MLWRRQQIRMVQSRHPPLQAECTKCHKRNKAQKRVINPFRNLESLLRASLRVLSHLDSHNLPVCCCTAPHRGQTHCPLLANSQTRGLVLKTPPTSHTEVLLAMPPNFLAAIFLRFPPCLQQPHLLAVPPGFNLYVISPSFPTLLQIL